MKINLRNLGVINNASIDLKPLTVFIGDNGTGKTWAAYTLSAILGLDGYEKYHRAFLESQTQQTYPPLDKAIRQLLEEGNAQIDLVQFANDYAELYINEVARLAPKWMRTFMATRRVTFENLQMHISLADAKPAFLDKITAVAVEKKLSFGSRRGALLNALKESGNATLYFYSEGEVLKKLPSRAVKQFVGVQLFQILHSTFYSKVYTLPTERTTFITFPFHHEAIKKNEKSEGNRLAPVQSFLGMIADAYLPSISAEREEQIKENPQILEYVKLADILETDILQGKLSIDTSGLLKELLFQPAGSQNKLEMPIVSSMVKELAPLVLYLRYFAEPNEWLIIDEPEMNLHPAAQVEIIEFLAMLVNAGLHVLITTHSPYIVDHLANLMQAAKHDDKEGIDKLFYLEQRNAFIPQAQVSIYLFEEGTAKNIVDEDGIIDWSTFGDVSSYVSSMFPQLLKTTK
ncbi:MAG: AAA family ATPase [Pseudomonadota bacterium]